MALQVSCSSPTLSQSICKSSIGQIYVYTEKKLIIDLYLYEVNIQIEKPANEKIHIQGIGNLKCSLKEVKLSKIYISFCIYIKTYVKWQKL